VHSRALRFQIHTTTCPRLRPYFSERAIVELTWLMALENDCNHMNRALNIGPLTLCEVDLDHLQSKE
jgi:alkylhydroperoxidase family enzyme